MRNPKTEKETHELFLKLFVPKPCPCCEPSEEQKKEVSDFIKREFNSLKSGNTMENQK